MSQINVNTLAWRLGSAELGARGVACPSQCSCGVVYGLQRTNCAGKGLSSVPSGISDNTQWLDLEGNRIERLTQGWLLVFPQGVFDRLMSLQKLYLSANQLSALPAGVFDKLTQLTYLSLRDNNQLSALPVGIFDKLTQLTILSLYENKLTALPAGVFDKLTLLTGLSLHDNQLKSIPRGSLLGVCVSRAGWTMPISST
ncbi:chondroadherin-like [Lethenteron reissneri]|uniref:chondroadherin-like n=1 Tax=Lethenteron reissneri TaxID=7753 RepID=UPI002AB7B78C|nr:chondroadherin-like [Lethenteron reissneri]